MKTSLSRASIALLVVAGVALGVAGGGGAVAAALITSQDIADDAILSVDVRDGTIASVDIRDSAVAGGDVKDSTLSSADVADGALTSDDYSGPPPPGTVPDHVYEWTVAFTENGSKYPNRLTGRAVPAGASVQGLDIDVVGPAATTCSSAIFRVGLVKASTFTYGELAFHRSHPDVSAFGTATVFPRRSSKLMLSANCSSPDGDVPMPTFTLTFKFAVTELRTSPPEPFS